MDPRQRESLRTHGPGLMTVVVDQNGGRLAKIAACFISIQITIER
jgi:hypothetical protein